MKITRIHTRAVAFTLLFLILLSVPMLTTTSEGIVGIINSNLIKPLFYIPYPDLTVTNLTWNVASPADGQQVNFTATVVNIGSGNTSRTFYTGFYVDNVLASCVSTRLNASGVVIVTGKWTAVPGTHSITAFADEKCGHLYTYEYDYEYGATKGVVAESDEYNNNLTLNMVVAYPDLIVTNVGSNVASPLDGQVVNLTAILLNNASGNTTRTFYTTFFVDNDLTACARVYGLNSSQSANIVVPWSAYPGNHTILVSVDISGCSRRFNNLVLESNETNNNRTGSVNVSYPDLIVVSIMPNTTSPADGEVITINATVRNTGVGTLRSFYVSFFVDDDVGACARVYGLNSSQSANIAGLWTASPGNHTILVSVDNYACWYRGKQYITESNENNNNLTSNINVLYPDLIVTNITWVPENPNDGDRMNFTATVTNVGSVDTLRSFYVTLAVDGSTIGCPMISSGVLVNRSKNVTASWIAVPGYHNISAQADWSACRARKSNRISESNESNNFMYRNSTDPNSKPGQKTYHSKTSVQSDTPLKIDAKSIGIEIELEASESVPDALVTLASYADQASIGKRFGVWLNEDLKAVVSSLNAKLYYTQSDLDKSSVDENTLVARQLGSDGYTTLESTVEKTDAEGYSGYVQFSITDFDNLEDNYYVISARGLPTSQNIRLKSGWNLISLPLTQ